jgi:hypothetical protein
MGVYLDILADNIYVIGSLDNFIESDYVRVHEETEDLYLAPDCDNKRPVSEGAFSLAEISPLGRRRAPMKDFYVERTWTHIQIST